MNFIFRLCNSSIRVSKTVCRAKSRTASGLLTQRELIQREKLGQGSGVDYLVLVPGSAALLGYDVGAESPLMDQLMLHLDREIEQTLDLLGNVVGAGSYSVMLSAAHGGPSGPPRAAIAGDQVAHAIEKSLNGVFKNVAYLCSRTRSKTWGKDAWKKVVVCIVSDGRGKINPRTRSVLAGMGCYQEGIAKTKVNDTNVTAHIYEVLTPPSFLSTYTWS